MYKKLIIGIACAALIPLNAFAFSDVSEPNMAKATKTLSSLSIVNGVGNNKFNPNGLVTRSEFAKMAVLTLGDTDTNAYKNLTIFPDVPHTHWASQYINSAVKEHKIIKGLPDGTFNPNGNINYGEAITMMLYMLDYEIADIGSYWPNDYVSLAGEIGIIDGLSFNATDKVTRGSAAIMLTNLLNAKTEKGTGDNLSNVAFPNSISDVFLISDPDILPNELAYVSGEEIITVSQKMDSIPYGAFGTLVFSDSSKDTAIGFIAKGFSENVVLKNAEIDCIETSGGDFKITSPAKVTLVVEDEVSTYDKLFLEMFPGSTITVNKNNAGIVTSVVASNVTTTSDTFLYSASKSIPSGYTIYKSGEIISSSQIKTNDVVSIDSQNRKVYVSDNKISGIYENGIPSIFYPSSVKVLGCDFNVLNSTKDDFKNLTINKPLTLHLDYTGSVAFVSDSAKSETVYLKSYDGSAAEIILETGKTVTLSNIDAKASGNFNLYNHSFSNIYKNIGKLVNVSFTPKGANIIRETDVLKSTSSDYNVKNGTVGAYTVSSSVELFDGIDSSSSYTRIFKSDITLDVIPSKYIAGISVENNVVTRIVFNNLTGEAFDYGLLTYRSDAPDAPEDPNEDDFSNSVLYNNYILATGNGESLEYKPISMKKYVKTPVGMLKGAESKEYMSYISVLELKKIGQVSKDNFLGSKFAVLNDKDVKISPDVIVYDSSANMFLSLTDARQRYEKFTLFTDNSLQNNSVRIIMVS